MKMNNKLISVILVAILAVFVFGIISYSTGNEYGENPDIAEVEVGTNTVGESTLGETITKSPNSAEINFAEMHEDLARIIEKDTLVVATTISDQPPLYWTNSMGELDGPEIDIARGIANALGVKLEILRWSDDYSELQNAVIDREADMIIAAYSNTLERAKFLNFSDVYMSSNYGVMANSSSLVQHDIEEDPIGYMLENPVKIGALGGSAHVDALRVLFPNCEPVEVFLEEGDEYENAYDKAAYMVADGELFAYFCVELEFLIQYEMFHDLTIYTSSFAFSDVSDSYAIAMHKDDTGLLAFVNLYLSQTEVGSASDVISGYLDYSEQEASK